MRNRFYIKNQNSGGTIPSQFKNLSKSFWNALLIVGTLFISQSLSAQCQLNCIQNLQVSLNENCEALITPNDILKSPGDCPGPKYVEILDKNNFHLL